MQYLVLSYRNTPLYMFTR